MLLTSLGVDAAHAQETGATRLAQTLSPLVNNQTLLVAHVDLTKLQPAEAFDQLADLLKLSSHDREASASLARLEPNRQRACPRPAQAVCSSCSAWKIYPRATS